MEPVGEPTQDAGTPVPRMRNPAAAPDSSPGKQSELKLNVGIGTLGTILSFACAVIFIVVLEELVLGIVFAVVGVVALVITLYVYGRLRRARQQSES